jgi:hypothetical protein
VKSSRDEVEIFLKTARMAIDNGRFTFIPRRKNIKSMARLGLSLTNILDELYDLTYNDYVSGPEPDDDRHEKDPVWIFKTVVLHDSFYIKIKIFLENNLKIISFHIAEY